MRLILFLLATCFIMPDIQAQLIAVNPQFVQENSSPVEITVDALKGNQALKNYAATGDVYVHIGVITNFSTSSSDWKYSKFAWGVTNPLANCISLGNNQWKFTINGGLRTYFNIVNPSEHIQKIALLFRNGNGSIVQRNLDGTDMYIPLYDNSLQVKLVEPFLQPTYLPTTEPINKNVGETINLRAKSSASANVSISFNGVDVFNQASVTEGFASPVIATAGEQTIVARATIGATTKTDTLKFFVGQPTTVAPLPPGVKDGINYEAGDASVVLVLYAPGKNSISVIGDFNNWTQSTNYQMSKTPDGNRFWLRISGLTPGAEYAYQYFIDGGLKVADYNTEKILDPSNDLFIPPANYPSLKPYPTGKTTGIVSVLQTAKPAYNWQVANFSRPDKKNLVIYELLLRDFLQQQNWKTLKDTLGYLKRLGVNVIEVMPFNEFEGNNSWGYNPSFFFAPDKFYGTENDLRAFIDECHKQGMAVVMDMVMNHAFGQSPLVQMYFDGSTGKPSLSSPWFNQDARHPFNVGYDFNHESTATKELVDRVVEHWLVNYKLDGFRWDLSKGFTQINNPNNVGAWGAYDPTRIVIWKRIFDKMQSSSPGTYCILEHFADNTEEKELSDYGMMLWGNMNTNVNEATMGWLPNSNFDGGLYTKRGWTQPALIGYQESHDEERLMYKNVEFGNTSNGVHNTRDLGIALKRNGMATAFWGMMPGPKMIWQFGELGYDYSITWCPSNGTVPLPYPSSQCRTDTKLPHWEYLQNSGRQELFNIYASLIKLKLTPNFNHTFTGNNVSSDLSGAIKWMTVQSDSLKVMVVGNFDVVARSSSISFPSAGPWYSYLVNGIRNATGSAETITLQPGEYYVYTNRDLTNQTITSIDDLRPDFTDRSMIIYPNPANTGSVVTYEIPLSGTVNISIWNMQGQRVAFLNEGIKAKGRYTVALNRPSFNINRLTAGNYVMMIDVNGKRMKKQFIINR